MKCLRCSSKATVHLTDIINGHKKELHLCADCAEKQQLLKKQELNLPVILQTIFNQHIGPPNDDLARLTCPDCGIKFMEFRAEGRLGCPKDYEVFRAGLEPLIQRHHHSGKHVGKVPRHRHHNAVLQAEIVELRQRLQQAVDQEAYEEAARCRDLLRQKEAADEPG